MSLHADPSAQPMPDDELFITRVLDAPVATVFHIWAAREHVTQWWGPIHWTTPHMEWDFRVGGAWRACIRSPEGRDRWMSGVFREIEPDKRIAFSLKWDAEHDIMDVDTEVIVTFREEDGKTIQAFHHTGFPSVALRNDHFGGWTKFVEGEQAYLEKLRQESRS